MLTSQTASHMRTNLRTIQNANNGSDVSTQLEALTADWNALYQERSTQFEWFIHEKLGDLIANSPFKGRAVTDTEQRRVRILLRMLDQLCV